MCKDLKFRKLRADEIQVRPTDTKRKGSCLLLLYQDARCAMNILDETVGQFGWQKQYENINGNIYCGIAINNEGEWVWKWDCGAFTAKEEDMQSKADASDATKRAAVCWGIGRELYATPKIKIKCPDDYYYNDKLAMTFTVHEIVWDGDRLESLIIIDRSGKVVYDFHWKDEQKNVPQQAQGQSQNKSNYDLLVEFCKQAKADGADQEQLKKFFKYYEEKSKTWNGTFNVKTLFDKWMERSKQSRPIPQNYNDMSIQQYEEETYGADSESNYY